MIDACGQRGLVAKVAAEGEDGNTSDLQLLLLEANQQSRRGSRHLQTEPESHKAENPLLRESVCRSVRSYPLHRKRV